MKNGGPSRNCASIKHEKRRKKKGCKRNRGDSSRCDCRLGKITQASSTLELNPKRRWEPKNELEKKFEGKKGFQA